METTIVLIILLLFAVVVGAFLGMAAFSRVNALADTVHRLEMAVSRLEISLKAPATVSESKPEPEPAQPEPAEEARFNSSWEMPAPKTESTGAAQPTAHPTQRAPDAWSATPEPAWLQHLRNNWMTWLGGICVGLGGVFMVKYGIEHGLLSPTARVVLGLLTGIALHVAAEWLRRNKGSDPVFAALAGGASITLYAALLAALHLYHLMSPTLVFVLLAVVSLFTMALSLAHGPMLAALGIVGAYIVPVLVSDNSGNVLSAMVYALIISAAGLLLLRYVYRPWLWWGVVAGGLGWWLISLDGSTADGFRGAYLAILTWAILAIPSFDWLLLGRGRARTDGAVAGAQEATEIWDRTLRLDQLSLLLILAAWAITILHAGWSAQHLWSWAPLVVVLGTASLYRNEFRWAPWVALCLHWAAWLLLATDLGLGQERIVFKQLPDHLGLPILYDIGMFAALYAAIGALQLRTQGVSHPRLALALVSPLGWLVLAYLLINGIAQSFGWSIATAAVGLMYGAVASFRLERREGDQAVLWLILGAHLAYSVAVSMYYREAGLTLALALQLITLTWLMGRYRLDWLNWMIKAVLVVVVARLTLNPWVASYQPGVHWSLWTYGGASLSAAIASWLAGTHAPLRRWLEAGALHLLVLTLGAEVRYWLYDGQIFDWRYDLPEASINTLLWGVLSLVYHYRASLAGSLAGLYALLSRILLVLSLGSYALAVTKLNPWWGEQLVSSTPLFNLLLPAYGLPVLLALGVARFHEPAFHQMALRIAGGGLLLFLTLEVRHLWQGRLWLGNLTGDGELYTYSAVWLILAALASLAGMRWDRPELYKAGMGLLAVVIAKIFLVDMAGLEGLWRVASFMGLGLSLLGLAWLHGRIRKLSGEPGQPLSTE